MNNVKFLWTKTEMLLTLGVPQDLLENTGGHIRKLFCKGQAAEAPCRKSAAATMERATSLKLWYS